MEKIDIDKIRGEWIEYSNPEYPNIATGGGNDTIESIKMVAEKINEVIDEINKLTK